MKKILLISALFTLCLSSRAQNTASFGFGLDLGTSITKSSEFMHFTQIGAQFGVDLTLKNDDILFLGAGFDAGICSEKFLNIGNSEKLVLCPFYFNATYDLNNVGSMTGGLYGELKGGIAFGGLVSQKGSRTNSGYFAFGFGYQVDSISAGLEFSLYPGMTSTIDGYTVTRDSTGSNLAIRFKYRFGKARY